MPRARFLVSVPALCFILLHALFGIVVVTADCWYDNEKHEEGVEVATAEPCLNCTCNRGALLCYLRVCPKLPNPPPPGCILLHRFRACCPELICSDIPSGNGIESRSDTDLLEVETEQLNMANACFLNGSIYGPGSAMDSSSDCEYCYCLGGQQKCVRPKCLLPIDGCVAAYKSNDCCPIHYNCTRNLYTSTTTTIRPIEYESKGGCIVDNNFYPEGGKVLGIGHSICDNCYCLRGLVRCEPLSCAPPLLGCSPVIKTGECCAASYNCSGTIETQPEPFYGEFPTVSKDYAKLRKEVQHKRAPNIKQAYQKSEETNDDIPYYVLAESTKETTSFQFHHPTFLTRSSSKTKSTRPEIYYVPTKIEKIATNLNQPEPVNNLEGVTLSTTIRHKKYTNNEPLTLSLGDFDEKFIQNQSDIVDSTTIQSTLQTSTPATTIIEVDSTTRSITTIKETTTDLITTTEPPTTILDENIPSEPIPTNTPLITILNSTDCLPKFKDDNIPDETTVAQEETTTQNFSKIAEAKEDLDEEFNLTTKSKESDYDYDYNPTLPPSLPNLRIIPFLAADALDAKKLSLKRHDNKDSKGNFEFNQFSPPAETEGGFVPKEPPHLDNFYENNYHTTNIGTNSVTTLPVPAITNPPKTDENNCMVHDKEINHGESIPSEGACAICVCFYGSIVCHEPQCPLPPTGCVNSENIDRSTCCPFVICEDEEPELTTTKQKLPKPDRGVNPFNDVLRTEPPPDLRLLMGDMSNYLSKRSTTSTTEKATTITTPKSTTISDENLSIDKIWQYLFANAELENRNKPRPQEITTTAIPFTTSGLLEIRTANQKVINGGVRTDGLSLSHSHGGLNHDILSHGGFSHSSLSQSGVKVNNGLVKQINDPVGLLKLAGCNIYGRMYRVGRIISELSGPCLECKCTEIGVQCENLKC